MFLKFDGAYLQMNRGDTFVYPLIINQGTELNFIKYNLEDDDSLYVAIMEPNQSFEDALIRKKYTSDSQKDEDGNILFILNPIDTEYVETGNYYITVKLRKINNGIEYVKTLLPLREFIITGTSKNYDSENFEVDNTGENEKVVIYEGGIV